MEFDKKKLQEFFAITGSELRDLEVLGEVSIYGGGALLLLYDWFRTTDDFDIVIKHDENHAVIREAVNRAVSRLGLPAARPNATAAILRFGSNSQFDTFQIGSYPKADADGVGLRVRVATPEHLFTSGLRTLESAPDRRFEEIVSLGVELGISTPEHVIGYSRIYLPENGASTKLSTERIRELCTAIENRRNRINASR